MDGALGIDKESYRARHIPDEYTEDYTVDSGIPYHLRRRRYNNELPIEGV
jgi:hypothetical protein